MAISTTMIYGTIDKLIDAVRNESSEEKIRELKKKCRDDFERARRNEIQRFVVNMAINLYDNEIEALRLDMSKLCIGKGVDVAAKPEERSNLLRCLIGSLLFFFDNDFGAFMELCELELEFKQRKMQKC